MFVKTYLSLCLSLLSSSTFPRAASADGQKPLLPPPDYDATHLRYAAFGDSWASGINYGPPDPEVEYDFEVFEEVCRCRRVNEAYPVQLRDDSHGNWTDGRIPELDFQACHGADFNAIPDQVSRLNQSHAPQFATLTVGGNNGRFADIIENCIFQPDKDTDYGPEYPDADGECAKVISQAKDDVRASWFKDGIRDSINAILNEPRIKADRRFRLYVLGYAGMFNHDDGACNNQTFGILPGKQPRLTTRLRKDINSIIDEGRALYDHYINHELNDRKVKFIDINPVFARHRFCEPTPGGTQAEQVNNSWLWSLEWPTCIPLTVERLFEDQSRSEDDNIALWPPFCRKCGDVAELGELQRPFHPKPDGHKAIKDLLVRTLIDDAQRSGVLSHALNQHNLCLAIVMALIIALINAGVYLV